VDESFKTDLLKVFSGANIYFEKKNAAEFINKAPWSAVFGVKPNDFVENAPELMFSNNTKIFFVVDLEPKINDLKEAILDARKKFNTYHFASFFNETGKPKLVHCLLLVKKEHWEQLKETLQEMVSEKNKQYNWIENAKMCVIGDYRCISLPIDIFYSIVRC
jgi:hypothetical protein